MGFAPEIAVLPISVAALMPPKWMARHLVVPEDISRVILPGHCRGDLRPVIEKSGSASVELGPEDLNDLPGFFGERDRRLDDYGKFDVEILAEINHAPRLSTAEILRIAGDYRSQGADIIDLGCDPGGPWSGVAEAVKALKNEGFRVSIDSFDPIEVADAVRSGAELVLSVNASNRRLAADWGVEVVALPDRPGSLDGLEETADFLESRGIPYRLDPIVEPVGFGFAASLGRYLECRTRWPNAPLLMGIGNLTELTDVDSSGVNTILIGFCQEVGVRSVPDDIGHQLGEILRPGGRSRPPVGLSCGQEQDDPQARRAAIGDAPRPQNPPDWPRRARRAGDSHQGSELADLRRGRPPSCHQREPFPERSRPGFPLREDGRRRPLPRLLPRPRVDESEDRPDARQGVSPGSGPRLGLPDRARDQPSRPPRDFGMIFEGIVTTLNPDGSLNVAPMGPDFGSEADRFTLKPFKDVDNLSKPDRSPRRGLAPRSMTSC